MKTLYLECGMGAAGDMLMGALYELLPEEQKRPFLETMNSLMENVSVEAPKGESCFIRGTHMEVKIRGVEEETEDITGETLHHHDDHHHDHEEHHHSHDHGHGHDHAHHHHASMEEITGIISSLPVPEEVKARVREVYGLIAEAEAAVHGKPVTEVHLHEVGAKDAIADITGVCLALHLLAPGEIIVSPVHLGSGQVRCAHGIMPVPAPATARLTEGMPCYTGDIRGELLTPTGAALLKRFASSFGAMPVMVTEKTGMGLGRKQFDRPNAVRAFLGERIGGPDIPAFSPVSDAAESARLSEGITSSASGSSSAELISELCCHIDDMTPEALSFASRRLMQEGALDVSVSPLTMKKGRPGWALTVLCLPEQEEQMARAILLNTTTNGVRAGRLHRYVLQPSVRTAETIYGPIRIKRAEGFGILREKPEYDDVAAAAEAHGLPFSDVWNEARRHVTGAADPASPK